MTNFVELLHGDLHVLRQGSEYVFSAWRWLCWHGIHRQSSASARSVPEGMTFLGWVLFRVPRVMSAVDEIALQCLLRCK
jgi:hypothetical protein